MQAKIIIIPLVSILSLVAAQDATDIPAPSSPQATAATSASAPSSPSPAASSTGTSSDVPPCILSCLTQAAQSTGCGMTDKSCACTNNSFQQASGACIKLNCSPLEQAAAVVLQQRQCATVSSMSPTTMTAPSARTTDISNVAIGLGGFSYGWVAIAVALGLAVAF